MLIFGGVNLPFPCYLRKKSYPKLLTVQGSSPVHNPLFSRTAADGHTTSPSLGSSIRINKLTLIFFTTIAPSSPPKLAHFNPGSILFEKKIVVSNSNKPQQIIVSSCPESWQKYVFLVAAKPMFPISTEEGALQELVSTEGLASQPSQ